MFNISMGSQNLKKVRQRSRASNGRACAGHLFSIHGKPETYVPGCERSIVSSLAVITISSHISEMRIFHPHPFVSRSLLSPPSPTFPVVFYVLSLSHDESHSYSQFTHPCFVTTKTALRPSTLSSAVSRGSAVFIDVAQACVPG